MLKFYNTQLYIDLEYNFLYSHNCDWHNNIEEIRDIETNSIDIKNDIEKYLNIEKSYTSLSGEYGVEYFGLLKGVFDSQSKAGQFKDLTLQLKQLIS